VRAAGDLCCALDSMSIGPLPPAFGKSPHAAALCTYHLGSTFCLLIVTVCWIGGLHVVNSQQLYTEQLGLACNGAERRRRCGEQVLRRMGLVPEAEADELEALGERVAVAAAAGVEADAEMGEVPDEFTVSAVAYDGAADSPPSAELSLARLPASCSHGFSLHVISLAASLLVVMVRARLQESELLDLVQSLTLTTTLCLAAGPHHVQPDGGSGGAAQWHERRPRLHHAPPAQQHDGPLLAAAADGGAAQAQHGTEGADPGLESRAAQPRELNTPARCSTDPAPCACGPCCRSCYATPGAMCTSSACKLGSQVINVAKSGRRWMHRAAAEI